MNNVSPVKVTLIAVSVLSVMVGNVVSPALPSIERAFADTDHVRLLSQLVLTMPALLVVLWAPLAGAISDRFGRKRLLLLALALFSGAGVSSFFVDSLATILVGRAFVGLAVAVTMTTATALIGDYYQGVERARLLGVQSASNTALAVFCLPLGGYLSGFGWRYPFLLYVLPAFVLVLAARYLYEPDKTSPVTGPGAGSLPVPGFLTVVLGIALISHTVMSAVPLQIPFYLTERFAVGGVGIGFSIAAATGASTLSSLCYGSLKDRLSYTALVSIAQFLIAAGFGLVGLASGVAWVVAGLAMIGAGAGIMLPAFNHWLSDVASQRNRGKLLGALTTILFLGQFIAPLFFTPLLAWLSYPLFFFVLAAVLVVLGASCVGLSTFLTRATDKIAASR